MFQREGILINLTKVFGEGKEPTEIEVEQLLNIHY